MNTELVKYMFDGILLSLLLGVAGLLVWFNIKLNKLMNNYAKMSSLSNVFGESLTVAKKGVQSLSGNIGEQIMEANKTLQEIEYVLDRAEKMMSQFDERLDVAKSHGIKPMAIKKQVMSKPNMAPPATNKQAVLPQNVVPKVVKTTPTAVKAKSAIEKSLVGRSLGGKSKAVRAFKPKQLDKSNKVIFKNTTIGSGTSAYGAAASAIQKSNGGKTLATQQEEGLIRALEERL